LYQAYHHDQNTPLHFIDDAGRPQPILEVNVLKNKMSGFKGGPLLFYFNAGKSRFEQIPQDKYMHFKRLVIDDIKAQSKGKKE